MLNSRWSWIFYAAGIILLLVGVLVGDSRGYLIGIYAGMVLWGIGALLDFRHARLPVRRQLHIVRKRAEWDRQSGDGMT